MSGQAGAALARIPLEIPRGADRNADYRCERGLVYLRFNGVRATAGEDWVEPGALEEATRLGASWQGRPGARGPRHYAS